MSEPLTPFPDGIGLIDHAWRGLSPTMRRTLTASNDKGRTEGILAAPRMDTLGALRRKGLLDDDNTITDRGRAVIEWARAKGLIT